MGFHYSHLSVCVHLLYAVECSVKRFEFGLNNFVVGPLHEGFSPVTHVPYVTVHTPMPLRRKIAVLIV